MIFSRPTCTLTTHSNSQCSHPGWEHAENQEQVERALAANEEVYDQDGDLVVGIRVVRRLVMIHYYPGGKTDEGMSEYDLGANQDGSLNWTYILIRPQFLYEPVTDEEIEHTVESIKKAIP